MIKKLNAILIILVLAMFAAKIAMDAAEGKHRTATVASEAPAVRNAGFAPRIVFSPWLPYAILNPLTGRNGYALDVMRAIFPESTFEQRELTAPETREILAASSNTVCVTYGDHPQLREFAHAPTPVVDVEIALYYRRGLDWKYRDESSLTNVHIGVTDGYMDCALFRRLAEEAKASSRPFTVFAPTSPYYANPFRAVLEGKVDAVGYSRVTFDAATLGVTADMLMHFAVTPTIAHLPIYMTVSSGDPARAKALVEAYERGCREIEASGELRRIREYYVR